MRYRRDQGVGLFDKENTLQELLENGNPLPKLKEIIDFEQFLASGSTDTRTMWRFAKRPSSYGTTQCVQPIATTPRRRSAY
jgi:hypothetical protein